VVILITSTISLFFYQLGASVPLAEAWPLAAGSAAGGLLGAWLTPRLPNRLLRRPFAAVVVVAGFRREPRVGGRGWGPPWGGAWLTPRLPNRLLRRLFAAVVVVAGFRMVTG